MHDCLTCRAVHCPQGLQFPQLNYDVALMLAREYKVLVDRTRQRRLAALHAQLSNGTLPGWKTVLPCHTNILLRTCCAESSLLHARH